MRTKDNLLLYACVFTFGSTCACCCRQTGNRCFRIMHLIDSLICLYPPPAALQASQRFRSWHHAHSPAETRIFHPLLQSNYSRKRINDSPDNKLCNTFEGLGYGFFELTYFERHSGAHVFRGRAGIFPDSYALNLRGSFAGNMLRKSLRLLKPLLAEG